jgi:hypothetical protein
MATLHEIANAREATSFAYITTATTTQVKTGAGFLHAIIINKAAAAAGTIKIIDNTSGTTANIATIFHDTGLAPKVLEYGIPFATGLRIVTSGADDITVIYR